MTDRITIDEMEGEHGERERRRHQRRLRWSRRAGEAGGPIKPRVLVVEPHDDTRLLYTLMLEEAGYVVYAVANGTDALRAAAQQLPDLVITEIIVPRLDGLALVGTLRDTPRTADIPVLVITGSFNKDVSQRARDVGAAVVLAKPTSLDVVLQTLDELMQRTTTVQLMRRHLRRTLLTIARAAAHATLDRDAQSRVRALVDRLQVAVLAVDERGRHLAASAGAASLTGYSRSELLTMSIYDLVVSETDLPNLRRSPQTDSINVELPQLALREKIGTTLMVDVLVTTLLPGVHAAAFTRVDGTDSQANT
jgi:PAS domain S-box-containing protein